MCGHYPLVSVIVPIYNVEDYLEECLQSIIEQTYYNLQIILVDDGSTDNSGGICDNYMQKDSRIEVIHKKNGGLSSARNAGLDRASGDFISFVDSDDKIHMDFIQHLYCEIINKNADISACGFLAAFKNQTIEQPEKKAVMSSREAIYKLIENVEFHDHVCTKLFKATIWKDIRFPVGKVYEDIRTTYRTILEADTVCVSDECLYWYRQRGVGIARGRFNNRRFEMLDAVQEMAKDSRICIDAKSRELIKNRIIRVESLILRSFLLNATDNDYIENKNRIDNCLADVCGSKWTILKDKTYPLSTKLIALLSNRSVNFLLRVFRQPITKKYYGEKYEYYT